MKKSNKMLRTIPAIMLAAAMLLLPSCEQSGDDTQKVVFGIMAYDPLYCEQGIFRWVDGVVYFADAESGSYVALCDKPNCLHEYGPDSTCNAVVHAAASVFPYQNGLCMFGVDNIDSLQIYQMDLNGTNRKLIGEIDGFQCMDAAKSLFENYLLIPYKNRYDLENDFVELEYCQQGVLLFNLDTHEFIQLPEKNGPTHFSLFEGGAVVGDSAYYSFYTVSEEFPEGLTYDEKWDFFWEHSICTLYRYDLTTGTETPIFTSESLFGVYYSEESAIIDPSDGIYRIDLTTGESERLFDNSDAKFIRDFNDEQIIYSTSGNSGTNFFIYDLETKTHQVIKENTDLIVNAIAGDKVYCLGTTNGEYAYSVIELEDFLNGHFAKGKVLYYPNRENPDPNAG